MPRRTARYYVRQSECPADLEQLSAFVAAIYQQLHIQGTAVLMTLNPHMHIFVAILRSPIAMLVHALERLTLGDLVEHQNSLGARERIAPHRFRWRTHWFSQQT